MDFVTSGLNLSVLISVTYTLRYFIAFNCYPVDQILSRSRMHGAIPTLPNTPSWRGA